jgi:hypothetical protein
MPDAKQMDEWTAKFKKLIVGTWRSDVQMGPVRSVSISTYRADGGVHIQTTSQLNIGQPMTAETSGTWIIDAINGEAFMLSLTLVDNYPLPQQMRVVDENTLKMAFSTQQLVRIAAPGDRGFLSFGKQRAEGKDFDAWNAKFRKAVVGTWRCDMTTPRGKHVVTATYSDDGRLTVENDMSIPGAGDSKVTSAGVYRIDAIDADNFYLRQEFTAANFYEEVVRMVDQSRMAVKTGQVWERLAQPFGAVRLGDAGLDEKFKRHMIGTWRYDSTSPPYKSVVTTTYRDDGTLMAVSETSIPGTGPMIAEQGGSWSVNGRDDKLFVLVQSMDRSPSAPTFLSIIDADTMEIPGLPNKITRVAQPPGQRQGAGGDLTPKLVGEWENRKQQGKVTNLERWTFGPDKIFRLQRTVIFGEVKTESPVETGSWRVDPGKPHGDYLALRWSTGETHTIEIEMKDPKTLYSIDDKETYVKVK